MSVTWHLSATHCPSCHGNSVFISLSRLPVANTVFPPFLFIWPNLAESLLRKRNVDVRVTKLAESEVPDRTQSSGGILSGPFAFCDLRQVERRTPTQGPCSALSTPLCPAQRHKEETGYVLHRRRRSVICRATTMSTAWGWGGRLWFYMAHTGS